MNLVQVATLITRVRQDANLDGFASVIPDAEIMDRLNRAKAEMVDELRASGGEGYFKRTYQLPIQGGVSVYQTPMDMISLLYVMCYLTPTQYFRCRPFTDDQRALFSTLVGTGWVFGQPLYYQLADIGNGGNIEFLPVPTSQIQNIVLGYQYSPPDFVIDAVTSAPRGSIDDVNGWSDFMVARAGSASARKVRQFELAAALQGEADRTMDRIKRMAPLRDMGAAEVQRDVLRSPNTGYWDNGGDL